MKLLYDVMLLITISVLFLLVHKKNEAYQDVLIRISIIKDIQCESEKLLQQVQYQLNSGIKGVNNE